jgi:propanol-preferring alcohol dehydrogenase
MSDIPAFPSALLWRERIMRSVANLARCAGEAFLSMVPRIPVRTHVEPFPLEAANEALTRLRAGRLTGGVELTVSLV